MTKEIYSTYEKLKFVHWAIEEALHGNMNELSDALKILKQLHKETTNATSSNL
tara:strand:- start:383 stop:541 length:159 start_codon:yes stop_codon:yes gene_type:complete